MASSFVWNSFQNGSLSWSEEADGGRGREVSRDFAKVGMMILGTFEYGAIGQ